MVSITGLHHVLLTVRDLARSTAFYEDLLGLRKVKEIPDDRVAGAKVLFALPDLPILAERLAAAGVEHSPRAPSAFGDPLVVFRDPDNIQLQLYGISEPPPV